MNRINLYFFGQERITLEDAFYFYGVQGAVISLLAFTAVTIR